MTDPTLIVYGGAFDPPHAGHADAVRRVLDRFPAAAVVVMPAAAPAVAGSDAAKAPQASFDDRAAMTALAFEGLGPRVNVSRLEAELPKPNFTVNTLQVLRAKNPGARLGLLIGGDQLEAFPKWRAHAEILQLAAVVAIGRNGPPPAAAFAPVIALEGWPPPAKSRKIRAAIAAREPVPDGWLAPAVRAYIDQKRLYAHNEVI